MTDFWTEINRAEAEVFVCESCGDASTGEGFLTGAGKVCAECLPPADAPRLCPDCGLDCSASPCEGTR